MAVHRSQVEPLSPAARRRGDAGRARPGPLPPGRRGVLPDRRTVGPAADGGRRPRPESLPAAFFEEFYAQGGDDPWGFTDRWYERRKRALTLAGAAAGAVPRAASSPVARSACSPRSSRERCDDLLALDVVPVDRPRRPASAPAHLPGVRVEQGSVPATGPTASFDLVVLSEVGYYCGPDDLRTLVAPGSGGPGRGRCARRLPLAAPRRRSTRSAATPSTRRCGAHPRLALLARHEEEDFLLDVLVPARRPPAWRARPAWCRERAAAVPGPAGRGRRPRPERAAAARRAAWPRWPPPRNGSPCR